MRQNLGNIVFVLTKCSNCICRLTIVLKNIIVIIISILVHIDRKNSESCFLLLIFFFRKYNLLTLLYI